MYTYLKNSWFRDLIILTCKEIKGEKWKWKLGWVWRFCCREGEKNKKVSEIKEKKEVRYKTKYQLSIIWHLDGYTLLKSEAKKKNE